MPIIKYPDIGFAIIPILFSAVVHSSVLSRFFQQDDFLHLYQIANTGFFEFFITPHSGHLLLFNNLVFFTLVKIFGLNTGGHFTVVLMTHMANVALLFWLIRMTTGRIRVASFCSTLWGICPLSQGSLGCLSVFGHVQAATFLLLLLVEVIRVNQGRTVFGHFTTIRWYIYLIGMATSFGVGLGIAIFFPLVLWFFLSQYPDRFKVVKRFLPIFVLLPLAYLGINWLYAKVSMSALPLSQFTYLSPDYWVCIVKMFFGILSYSIAGLLLGPFIVYGNMGVVFGPLQGENYQTVFFVSVCAALIFLTVMIIWIAKMKKTDERQPIFATLIMLSCVYGIISVGRAAFYVVGLKIESISQIVMISPRYHYIGTLCISVLLGYMLKASPFTGWLRRISMAVLVFWICLFLYPAWQACPMVAEPRDKPERWEFQQVLSHFKQAVHKLPEGSIVYLPNLRLRKIRLFITPDWKFPCSAALFMIAYPQNSISGREVRFVETNKKVIAHARSRTDWRIRSLLVSPEEARASCHKK